MAVDKRSKEHYKWTRLEAIKKFGRCLFRRIKFTPFIIPLKLNIFTDHLATLDEAEAYIMEEGKTSKGYKYQVFKVYYKPRDW